MTATLLVTAGLLWLIYVLAYYERAPRKVKVGSLVKVQARRHVYVKGEVVNIRYNGKIGYVDVAAEDGERYIRPMDTVEFV